MYTIGRKAPASIVIATKTVSQCTVTLEVGDFSPHAVTSFIERPHLTLKNAHETKPVRVMRKAGLPAETALEVSGGGSTVTLDHGDLIHLTASVTITVVWHPTEFIAGVKVTDAEVQERLGSCGALGIHVVRSNKAWVEGGSHLCLGQVKMTSIVMMAIAKAAHIVTLAYLDSVIAAGKRQEGGLEENFELPDPASFLPNVISSYVSADSIQRQILSDERRRNLFRGTLCLFVHLNESPNNQLQSAVDLFEACGGKAEFLSVSQNRVDSEADAQRVLRPYKSAALSLISTLGGEAQNAPDGGLVVLVQDARVHADKHWYQLLAAATNSMSVCMSDDGHSEIANAVLECDSRSKLNVWAAIQLLPEPTSSASSAKRSVASPPHLPQDPTTRDDTLPPPTAATAGSTQPVSVEPSSDVSPDPDVDRNPSLHTKARPRKRVGHRAANALDQLFGSQQSADPGHEHQRPSVSDSTQGRPSRNAEMFDRVFVESQHQSGAAKRRAATSQPRLSDIFGQSSELSNRKPPATDLVESTVPKTQHYRQQLEEEDKLNRTQGISANLQDQSLTSHGHSNDEDYRKRTARQLDSPTEVEQRAEKRLRRTSSADVRTSKSPAPSASNETDVTMSNLASQSEGEVIKDPWSAGKTRGKAPGEQPDTEPDFLQALASKRKGKKAVVDDFDREFNNLRLTKPTRATRAEQNVDETYEAWQATDIDDFDLPVGNFVQVDFVPLMRKGKPGEATMSIPSNSHGKPNFKKFKNKRQQQPRPIVEMDLNDPQDFGIGNVYHASPKHNPHEMRYRGQDQAEDDDSGKSHDKREMAPTYNILQALEGSESEEEQVDGASRHYATSRAGVRRQDHSESDTSIEDQTGTRTPVRQGGRRQAQSKGRGQLLSVQELEDDDDSTMPDLRLPEDVGAADLSRDTYIQHNSRHANRAAGRRSNRSIKDDNDVAAGRKRRKIVLASDDDSDGSCASENHGTKRIPVSDHKAPGATVAKLDRDIRRRRP